MLLCVRVFGVVRDSMTKMTLLEMELKLYFEEHKLTNVYVIGLSSTLRDKTLSELYKKMLTMPSASWMIDELVMPWSSFHTQWAGELQKMRSHMVNQPNQPMLWISIAGIQDGEAEHFKHTYLASLMPGFYVPVMELPLRNTKEVIKLAGLDSKDANRTVAVTGMTTNPSYSIPPNLMSGVQCEQIEVWRYNEGQLERAVEYAVKVMLERTAGRGFPVIFDSVQDTPLFENKVSKETVVAAVQKVVVRAGFTLLYTKDGSSSLANKVPEAFADHVEEWVRRWRRREEERILVTDQFISRGWEAPELIAVGYERTENLVMRTVGFCFFIKVE